MLPSQLFQDVTNSDGISIVTDTESLMQRVLLLLAEQVDILANGSNDTATLNWLVQALFNNEMQQGVPEKESQEYEWWMGARLIHSLLFLSSPGTTHQDLSPFEIHSLSNESIVFSERSRAHHILCLLLCAHSLNQCPSPIKRRWKRWQSVICETIRIFQSYRDDDGDIFQMVWVDHLVPACLHAISQLPTAGAHHVALVSALIGTTSGLATEWEIGEGMNLHPKLMNTLQIILQKTSFEYDETWVWLHPWRNYEMQHSDSIGDHEDDEDEEFLQFQNDIVWWATCVDCHESVAGMSTTWDDLGVALLALRGFDDRPQGFSPSQTWKVWFPHVKNLLKSFEADQVNNAVPLEFLDHLLQAIPVKSISTFHNDIKTPDSPLETFQLLANRILVQPNRSNASQEENRNAKAKTNRIVSLMKSLLDRYEAQKMIEIIEQLLNDCPHPGLKAKFLDFLRPLIFERDTFDLFWDFIGGFIQSLSNDHLVVSNSEEKFVNIDELIENVEIYVAAVTMVQAFALVQHKFPIESWEATLRSFHKMLGKSLGLWMNDSSAVSLPNNCYRLNLLEISLQQVLSIVDVENS